ncbi:hypothetical protein [Erysipelothrix rhusiopathiae]|uniref:hypothetical protein n=1 Tax=Erysipelothrix rhusiopathiae TaxID=1648 RepID=UPI003BF4BF34
MGWVTDIIRELIWMISYALLVMGDAIFDITKTVGSIRISQFKELWMWWGILSATIALVTAIRVIIMVLKYMLDDEYQQKTNMFGVFSKVLMVSMVMALLPFGVQTVTDAGASAVQRITSIVSPTSESIGMLPSTILISSIIGHSHEIESNSGVENIGISYKIGDIKINEKDGDGAYLYFDTLGDLFMLLIMGAFSSIMFILIGIQIAQRLFSLMMKVLVAPIPISGLVNPDDTSFQRWYRMIISDVVSNFTQLLLVNVVMIFSVSQLVRNNGVWVTLVVFLGGIMVCLTGIPELSSLIGGDTSTSGVMQQLASIRQASSGFGRTVGSTGKTLGSVAKKGLSGASNIGKKVGGVGKGFASAGLGFMAGKMGSTSGSNFAQGFTGGSSERHPDKQGNVFASSSTAQSSRSENKSTQGNSFSSNASSNQSKQAVNSSYGGNATNDKQFANQNVQSKQSDTLNNKNNINQGGGQQEVQGATPSKHPQEPSNTFNQKPKEHHDPQIKGNQMNKSPAPSRSSNVVKKAERNYGTKANPFVKPTTKGGSHVYKSSMNYKTKNTSTQKKVLKANEVTQRSIKETDKKFKGGN